MLYGHHAGCWISSNLYGVLVTLLNGCTSADSTVNSHAHLVDNQASRGRTVTRKVSENCELDNDTRFAGRTIDAKSIERA